MSKTLKGKYRPRNPEKYKGNVGEILYRSSWELAFMKWLDHNESVIMWQSEEKCIWYYNPVTKKKARYFPDFIVKYQGNDGLLREEVVEIKPQRQVDGPPLKPKRKSKSWEQSVKTYAINRAKWKAAVEWAENRGMTFRLLTEKDNPNWKYQPYK